MMKKALALIWIEMKLSLWKHKDPKKKDLIIQQSDKGNSIVPIIKSDYLDKMCNILSDSRKFVKSSVVDDKYLNWEETKNIKFKK